MPIAKLNDVLPPTRVLRAEKEYGVTMKTWPNGRTTVRREWATPKRSWELEWDGISLVEFQALEAHFDAAGGPYLTFVFEDPHTGVEYTVRYEDKVLDRRNARRDTGGLYKIKLKIEEYKP